MTDKKTIWKYKLPVNGKKIKINELIVRPLHIGAQGGAPTLWALVDVSHHSLGPTEIIAWGTGWDVPEELERNYDYWGTCEDEHGLIWHYFAATRYPEPQPWDKVETIEMQLFHNDIEESRYSVNHNVYQ